MMTPEQDLIAEVIKGERCCFTPRTQITGSFLLELCVRKLLVKMKARLLAWHHFNQLSCLITS